MKGSIKLVLFLFLLFFKFRLSLKDSEFFVILGLNLEVNSRCIILPHVNFVLFHRASCVSECSEEAAAEEEGGRKEEELPSDFYVLLIVKYFIK